MVRPYRSVKETAQGCTLKNVLIAAAAATTLADWIREAGHAPQTAATGSEALACAKSAPPDAAIIDVHYGGALEGLELGRALRAAGTRPIYILPDRFLPPAAVERFGDAQLLLPPLKRAAVLLALTTALRPYPSL